jgi:hypothetical protein
MNGVAARSAGARPAEAGPGRAPSPPPEAAADPRLTRLRALLRLELRAAAAVAWPTFEALAARVRDEVALGPRGPADPGAAAEVAHLQLRLRLLLEQRVAACAEALRRAAAGRAYRRLRPRG